MDNIQELYKKCNQAMDLAFRYKGSANSLSDLPNGEVGDVYVVDRETYVYANDWVRISEEPYYEPVRKADIPTNCKNCGGVINPYKLKCEFCGTVYGKPSYEPNYDDGWIETTTLGDSHRTFKQL